MCTSISADYPCSNYSNPANLQAVFLLNNLSAVVKAIQTNVEVASSWIWQSRASRCSYAGCFDL